MDFWLGRRRLIGLALKSPLSVLLSRGYLGHHMVFLLTSVLHVVYCWESKRIYGTRMFGRGSCLVRAAEYV